MSKIDKKQTETRAVLDITKTALFCKCPKCHKGHIFKKGLFSFDLLDQCDHCGFDLSKSDIADGPAVFLIFVLGLVLVLLALWIEMVLTWPIWLNIGLCGLIGLVLTLGSLKPLKTFVIALQLRYRASDWDDNPPPRV